MGGPPPWPHRQPDNRRGLEGEVLSGAERALLADFRQLGDAGRGIVRALIDHLRHSKEE